MGSGSKSDIIYENLKNEIISFKYEADDILNEHVIAKRFDVSKTPAREALAALAQDGYLIKKPRFGYQVKDLKINEYYEVVQYRFVLESGIVRIIVTNCSDEEISSLRNVLTEKKIEYDQYYNINRKFHLEMAKLTKNSYIYNALNRVFDMSRRELAHEYFKSVKDDIHRDHRMIVDALQKRDAEKAVELIRCELKRNDDIATGNNY